MQGIFHSFNVFRIREKHIPVDILEIKGKFSNVHICIKVSTTVNIRNFRDHLKMILSGFVITESIMAFAWEPTGNKFAFIHGESPRINVSVYYVQKGGSVELISK